MGGVGAHNTHAHAWSVSPPTLTSPPSLTPTPTQALDPAAADAAAAARDAAEAARGDGFVLPARNAVDYSEETELAADAALQAAR